MAHRGPIIPLVRNLEDHFHCRSRRVDTTLQECLNRFVEANAFELRRNSCFECAVGQRLRIDFAECPVIDDPPGSVS